MFFNLDQPVAEYGEPVGQRQNAEEERNERVRQDALIQKQIWKDDQHDQRHQAEHTTQHHNADLAAYSGGGGMAVGVKKQSHHQRQVAHDEQPACGLKLAHGSAAGEI